jgi:hypothetical protein
MVINSALYPFVGLNCETYLHDFLLSELDAQVAFFYTNLIQKSYYKKRKCWKICYLVNGNMKGIENEKR